MQARGEGFDADAVGADDADAGDDDAAAMGGGGDQAGGIIGGGGRSDYLGIGRGLYTGEEVLGAGELTDGTSSVGFFGWGGARVRRIRRRGRRGEFVLRGAGGVGGEEEDGG